MSFVRDCLIKDKKMTTNQCVLGVQYLPFKKLSVSRVGGSASKSPSQVRSHFKNTFCDALDHFPHPTRDHVMVPDYV